MINYDAVNILRKDNLIFLCNVDKFYPLSTQIYVLTFYVKTVKFPAASYI